VVTLAQLKIDPVVRTYMEMGHKFLGTMGALEHSYRHIELVASRCWEILTKLGYDSREAELAALAGYLHDIGNVANRYEHGRNGAMMVYQILKQYGMPVEEIVMVIGAIGNHEELSGHPVSAVAAAVIIADKTDVHYTRVRKEDMATFTLRDKVNYAVKESFLEIDADQRRLSMRLKIDLGFCSIVEYFEIFLTKMILCRRAAAALDCVFVLIINDVRFL
jgi:HD superfamily phosphodiesterase